MSDGTDNRKKPVVGHASRMKLPLKARFLMLGNFLVFAAAIENEELQRYLADTTGLHFLTTFTAEIVVSMILFIAWAALTVGWMQMMHPKLRDKDE